jgi:hypothetical protein
VDPISWHAGVGGGGVSSPVFGGGFRGKLSQSEILGNNSLLKYCNFVFNLDRSLKGCIYDGRSYVRYFFPRRKPSFMYEEIVLWL